MRGAHREGGVDDWIRTLSMGMTTSRGGGGGKPLRSMVCLAREARKMMVSRGQARWRGGTGLRRGEWWRQRRKGMRVRQRRRRRQMTTTWPGGNRDLRRPGSHLSVRACVRACVCVCVCVYVVHVFIYSIYV